MSRVVNADFFTVEKSSNSDPEFEQVLHEISQIPHNSVARNITHFDNPIRMASIAMSSNRQEWIGDMVKIRMDNIPPKASTTGSLNPLQLSNDEGLGEETAFLYIPRHKVIVVQRNFYGVAPSIMCKYMSEKSSAKASYKLKPIISNASFDRLRRMSSVSKMQISFANINNSQALVNRNDGLGDALNNFERYGAISAEITLSVGKTKKSMDIRNVIRTALSLHRHKDTNTVKKIEISGSNEYDSKTVLDLLEDRIVYKETIPSDENRNIPRSRRFDFLQNAWADKSDEILSLI